ncbi:MAG: ATP-binding protein [Isosphaerales bacterium]
MSALRSIYETCRPRADVEAGTTKDEQFAADLAQVVNQTAPKEYTDPAVFFRHSYPTRGMKELLKAVLTRLSGKGGEIASIIRLDTQYGGGKTHSLIALVHAVRGMKRVKGVEEFVDPALLPKGPVRVAALDGENSDPADGLTLEPGLRAKTLWGELAYRLAGAEGDRRVQKGDEKHSAPGATTLVELFGGQPTLIMIDEVSVYLRKVERVHPGASGQFTAFLQALFKAVDSAPNVSVVFTLAVGKDSEAKDAYREEHERALSSLAEAEMVASRKATQLNPTEEDETADVLRRRLFDKVDRSAADAVVAAYADVWTRNQNDLPSSALRHETRDQFRRGYPLHPETLSVLTEKLSSLSTFQRTRGMLRLLARTVHVLWRDKPADALAIHPHHIDPGFGPIRDEITTRLGQGEYTPALKSDVAAVSGDNPSIAQELDLKFFPGQLPIHSYVARTVFLHTLAFGDAAKGIATDHLKLSVCSPLVEPSFVEQARARFITESLFLDDRPGALLRFMVEPNLTQVIRRQMDEVEATSLRTELDERIRNLFGASGGSFNLQPFPAGGYEVDDLVGDGRPNLVLLHHDAFAINADPQGLPPLIDEIFKYKGADQRLREFRNNLVFVVADERQVKNMKDRVRRRLALRELRKPDRKRVLAAHQQDKVEEEFQKSSLQVAEAILHCYRHLFFPSNLPMPGSSEPIAHAAIEVPHASDLPGNGQLHVARVLRENHKLLSDGDTPEAPTFVRDQTPLKLKGELSTLELRNEYRRAPKLSMLVSNGPLVHCIRQGIESEVFIYREGNQIWGKGDPAPVINVTDDAFVHTVADARKKHLWPRAEPLVVTFSAAPREIGPQGKAELKVTVTGGVPPYTYTGTHADLSMASTTQTVIRCDVSPEASLAYRVEVTDSRGQRKEETAEVLVAKPGEKPSPPKKPDLPVVPTKPAPPPRPELNAEGPLAQSLTELWEKARKAKVQAIEKLVIRFFEASATWKVHQAMAMLKEASVNCRFEADIKLDGVNAFVVEFDGRMDRANAIKSFLDPQLRAAAEHAFTATYTLAFTSPLATTADKTEAFTKNLTRYGSGEAYVEAHAAALETKS